MMEGRSPGKCGRYFVSGVARRWDAFSVCRVVLFVILDGGLLFILGGSWVIVREEMVRVVWM